MEAIRSLGFFNMKAKNVMRLSQILVEEHGGEVPREREALERLPGVGRKTANVVLNIAFKRAGHRGRHAHFSRLEPHRPCARRDGGRRRRSARKGGAGKIQAACPPLADPARALRLRRAQAEMPDLRDRRHLPLQGQDRAGGGAGRHIRLGALRPCLRVHVLEAFDHAFGLTDRACLHVPLAVHARLIVTLQAVPPLYLAGEIVLVEGLVRVLRPHVRKSLGPGMPPPIFLPAFAMLASFGFTDRRSTHSPPHSSHLPPYDS